MILKHYTTPFYSLLVSLFFILLLYVRAAYTAIPLFIAISGISLFFLDKTTRQLGKTEKWLIGAFVFYVLLFVLSLLFHGGKIRELDAPTKVLFLLPVFLFCSRIKFRQNWIIYAIIAAAICAGLFATYRFSILKIFYTELFPAHMYIQSGGFMMSLGLFCLVIAFHFYRQKTVGMMWLALIASSLAIWASLINQARGAWLLTPFIVLFILWIYRKLMSKGIIIFLLLASIIAGGFAGQFIKKRWDEAVREIDHYVTQQHTETSVGARLDMWKSAWIGIQEKPIFGRGISHISEMREQHLQQGLISRYAASFSHAHNQYLHDATARGILGLGALLSIFFVPLWLFWRGLSSNSLSHLWGMLGITHVLAMMGYCLTQAFFAHNSGVMFYFFTVLLFLGLQKSAQNQPLVEAK